MGVDVPYLLQAIPPDIGGFSVPASSSELAAIPDQGGMDPHDGYGLAITVSLLATDKRYSITSATLY